MDHSITQIAVPKHPVRRDRLALLLIVLLFLAVCHFIGSMLHLPSKNKAVPWLTPEAFYQFIEGESIALPDAKGTSGQDGKSLTLHRETIESLRIEPGGDGPESEGAQVTFVIRTHEGPYGVQGFVSLHNLEGTYYPIVNLGLGWNVTKK